MIFKSKKMDNPHGIPDKVRAFFLVALRIAIGWHFLYEGLVKIFDSSWTSSGYLIDSKGFLAPVFRTIASDPGILRLVDFLNEWGLVLIGTGLILGIFNRVVTISGMALLAFYYLSHPPLTGYNYVLPSEGNYFIVDKVLIELIALGVLFSFPSGMILGLDRLICRNKNKT